MAGNDLDYLIQIEAPVLMTITVIMFVLFNQQRQYARPQKLIMYSKADDAAEYDSNANNQRQEAQRSSTNNISARNSCASRATNENIMNEKLCEQLDVLASLIEKSKRTWKEKLSEALWSMDGFDDDDLEMVFEELRGNKNLAEGFYLRKPSLRKKWLANSLVI